MRLYLSKAPEGVTFLILVFFFSYEGGTGGLFGSGSGTTSGTHLFLFLGREWKCSVVLLCCIFYDSDYYLFWGTLANVLQISGN